MAARPHLGFGGSASRRLGRASLRAKGGDHRARQALERIDDRAAVARGAALPRVLSPRVERGVHRVDGDRAHDVALVVIDDDGQRRWIEPGSPEVVVELEPRREVLLLPVFARIGDEDDAARVEEHIFAAERVIAIAAVRDRIKLDLEAVDQAERGRREDVPVEVACVPVGLDLSARHEGRKDLIEHAEARAFARALGPVHDDLEGHARGIRHAQSIDKGVPRVYALGS